MPGHRNRQQLNTKYGDYFFFIDGLPPNYTWKKLKDIARKQAPNLGWTDMFANDTQESQRQGWVRVKRENEAFRLYDFFKGEPFPNRRLRVYLWSTTSFPPELMACNCPAPSKSLSAPAKYSAAELQLLLPALSLDRWQPSPPLPTFQRDPILNGQLRHDPVMNNSRTTAPPAVPDLQGLPSPYLQSPVSQASRRISPVYVYSGNNNLPINISAGCVPTELRKVFISGLNYKTTERRLFEFLSIASNVDSGILESCEIQGDPVGRSRGYAFARFSSNKAAVEAVEMFNGVKLDGKVIRVRLDKEEEGRRRRTDRLKDGEERVRQESVVIANGSSPKLESAAIAVGLSPRVGGAVIANGSTPTSQGAVIANGSSPRFQAVG